MSELELPRILAQTMGSKLAKEKNVKKIIFPQIPLKYNQTQRITFNNVCLAIILAKNRIDKLISSKTNEINSIGTSKKAKAINVPEGRNNNKM